MDSQNNTDRPSHCRLTNRLVSTLIFLVLSATFVFVFSKLQHNENQSISRQISAEGINELQVINLDLQKRVRSLQRLVNRWEVRKGIPKAEFESDVAAMVADDPGYQAVEWVDQSFHIRWIVPMAGNEAALGLDLAFEENRLNALKQARDNRAPTLSSPIDLVQGGKGFLIYNPIFFDNQFDGFVLAVFRTDTWLNHLLSSLDIRASAANFVVQVYLDDALIYESEGWADNQQAEWERLETATLFEHEFSIHVRPIPSFLKESGTLIPEMVLMVGTFLSFLISIIVFLFRKTRSAKHQALLANSALELEIEERHTAEKLLSEERQRLENIIEGTRAATWEWNIQTGETKFDEKWANIIGYTLNEISPVSIETWTKYAHPEDLKISSELLDKNFSGELDYYECEIRMRHRKGHWVWVLDRGKVSSWSDDGKPLQMFGTHQDITERKQFEEKIHYLATHDSLTGIPNLRVAQDRMLVALKRAKRTNTLVAVLFIDLDGFKDINDNYGHDVGDSALKKVASRLNSCVRESDTVARMGGDEFLIILSDVNSADQAKEVAAKSIQCISQPIKINGLQLVVGASIGIALYPLDGTSSEALFKVADNAMYATKNSGKNGYAFANEEVTRF